MLKVCDEEMEYWIEDGRLMTLHLDDYIDPTQIDAEDFSSFEHDVWSFLTSMESANA